MVDKFRNDFFEKVIKEEKERENALKLAQIQCFHNYITENVYTNGYEQRTCSKCAHSDVKHIRVWNATKNGQCIIA